MPHLGSLTGGHTTPDLTGKPLKGVVFDLSHLGVSCQVCVCNTEFASIHIAFYLSFLHACCVFFM